MKSKLLLSSMIILGLGSQVAVAMYHPKGADEPYEQQKAKHQFKQGLLTVEKALGSDGERKNILNGEINKLNSLIDDLEKKVQFRNGMIYQHYLNYTEENLIEKLKELRKMHAEEQKIYSGLTLKSDQSPASIKSSELKIDLLVANIEMIKKRLGIEE